MSLVNSLQCGKAWQECAQQTEKSNSHTNSAVSRQVYVHDLLVQHLYRPSVFFQHMFWYGPKSETAWMQRRQKNWLKYTDFTELKKVTSRIYSRWSNHSSLFFKSFKFRCCSFCFIKKCTANCTSVLLILLFASWYIFQRKSKEWGFWRVLLFF